VPGGRTPIFIDARGVPCAAGALIIESGASALAHRIAATMNEAYLDQMNDDVLAAWVADSGLTLGELRLIQPAYGYASGYADPLLRAAHFGDVEQVKKRLGPSPAQAALNDAIRAAAARARSGRVEETRAIRAQHAKQEIGIFEEPAPWVTDGLSLVAYLIKRGADVNDVSNARASILYDASPDARPMLISAGAKLTANEFALDALKRNDCVAAAKALSAPELDFTAQQVPAPRALATSPACVAAILQSQGAAPGTEEQAWLEAAQNDPKQFSKLLRFGVPIASVASLGAGLHAWRLARAPASGVSTADVERLERLVATEPKQTGCVPQLVAAVSAADTEAIDLFVGAGVVLGRCTETDLGRLLSTVNGPLSPAQHKTISLWVRGRAELDFTSGEPPLKWAILHHDLALVNVLLEGGAKVTFPNQSGRECTSLALAAAQDQLQIVGTLLEHHAPRATTFVAQDACPGSLHPERPRPTDPPPPKDPLQRGAIYFAQGSAPHLQDDVLITITDMKLSPKMRSALGLTPVAENDNVDPPKPSRGPDYVNGEYVR